MLRRNATILYTYHAKNAQIMGKFICPVYITSCKPPKGEKNERKTQRNRDRTTNALDARA